MAKKRIHKAIYYFSLLVFILTLSGSVFQLTNSFGILKSGTPMPKHGDPYDPQLIRLRNINSLVNFVDSIALIRDILVPLDQTAYTELTDSIVSLRFYHGLQHYSPNENYIAYLLGKFLWLDFSAKVIPDHILKGQHAFCSQSSIVFQELLKRKDISVRSIALPGHFCTEVLIDDNWYFHDVSMKPRFTGLNRKSVAELLVDTALLHEAYAFSWNKQAAANLEQYFQPGKIMYGQIEVFAAPRMLWVHWATHWMSWLGWFPFLIILLILRKQMKS